MFDFAVYMLFHVFAARPIYPVWNQHNAVQDSCGFVFIFLHASSTCDVLTWEVLVRTRAMVAVLGPEFQAPGSRMSLLMSGRA
jgi:hypothetical protein